MSWQVTKEQMQTGGGMTLAARVSVSWQVTKEQMRRVTIAYEPVHPTHPKAHGLVW